ncbi:hypothetical protein GCM10010156_65830 [Planobispora rosea]|uniref:Uncharacterized protein n=1 Tax=Planobispora rosea TaxID=35762 RepID=A0A8J3S604_PLARO|nr:hypothetical protein [Planobispora rosea]GGS98472.1 hypothetical protein GCM10010156_65830 [Planobispora rosea]GIH87878.1 hypothetical protein Pro02_62860 [Planobispora rosea]
MTTLSGVCVGVHRPGGQPIADKMLFMVAAMAVEMGRDLIRERTIDSLPAPAIDADKLAAARARWVRRGYPGHRQGSWAGRSTL